MRAIICSLVFVFATAAGTAGFSLRQLFASEEDCVRAAGAALEEFMLHPTVPIPDSILDKAQAVAIFPGLMGTESVYWGEGVISARSSGDSWSPPAFLQLQNVVLRFKSPVPPSEIMLIATTRRGLDYLLFDRFDQSEDIRIPAGPVGRHTAANLKADVLAYARFGTVVAGANLEAVALRSDTAANRGLYRMPWTTFDIIVDRRPDHPGGVGNWRQALALLFPRPGSGSN